MHSVVGQASSQRNERQLFDELEDDGGEPVTLLLIYPNLILYPPMWKIGMTAIQLSSLQEVPE